MKTVNAVERTRTKIAMIVSLTTTMHAPDSHIYTPI